MPVMPVGACIVAHAAERSGHTVHLPGPDVHQGRDGRGRIGREGLPTRPGRRLGAQHRQQRHAEHGVLPGRPAGDRRVLRTGTGAPIFLGGAALGVMPEEILRLGDASGCVIGDGETIFPLLADRISRGGSFHDLPGVASIEDGTFRRNPPAPRGFGRVPGAGLSSMAGHEGLSVSPGDGPDPDQDQAVRSSACTAPTPGSRGARTA